MKITVVGTGYVGLSNRAGLLENSNDGGLKHLTTTDKVYTRDLFGSD